MVVHTDRPAAQKMSWWREGVSPLRHIIAPYSFVAPFLLIFALFSVYPLIYALRLSFTRWHGIGEPRWIGWSNYTYLLSNPDFWRSLLNSSELWLIIVPVQLFVGVIAAVLLNNSLIRARGFFRTSFIIPFVSPLVAIAQIWIVLFDQKNGVVNSILHLFGLPQVGWLTTSAWSKITLGLLFLWKTTGFAIIILLSGLQGIDSTLYEAAEIDGATKTRQLRSITLPLLRRTLMFLLVLQTLAVFQMFAEPYIVTQGGPYGATTTAGLYLYNHITLTDLGTGAANSFILVAIVMSISMFFVRVLRARD